MSIHDAIQRSVSEFTRAEVEQEIAEFAAEFTSAYYGVNRPTPPPPLLYADEARRDHLRRRNRITNRPLLPPNQRNAANEARTEYEPDTTDESRYMTPPRNRPERFLTHLLQRQYAVSYETQLQFDAFRQGQLPALFPAPEMPHFTPSMHSDASCSTVESELIFVDPWWGYYQADDLIPQWSHHSTPEAQVYY